VGYVAHLAVVPAGGKGEVRGHAGEGMSLDVKIHDVDVFPHHHPGLRVNRSIA
jgi:hypothetical protein